MEKKKNPKLRPAKETIFCIKDHCSKLLVHHVHVHVKSGVMMVLLYEESNIIIHVYVQRGRMMGKV